MTKKDIIFFVSVTEALIESGEVEDINGSGSMYM